MQRQATKETAGKEAGENRKIAAAGSKPDLAEAKARFLAAANEFSPLGIVQRRPFASIGVAFLAGFGISALGASRATAPAMATMSQIVNLAAQFAPLIVARARSSDG